MQLMAVAMCGGEAEVIHAGTGNVALIHNTTMEPTWACSLTAIEAIILL